ncbi:Appr-1-p processing protein [Bacillus sp. FJAT-27231]|uniref:O-acetyl-ADP-ribose deacetylase n=1 Tax=Bacillus sp. FJAT-27231 TaxID=1679168 RepID=UPI000670ABD4|nr:O-acetyl-ADP-ribose deacetylase [Bacillus sp. FJAT-27231]KMY55594.1 Appr-1-p processing protein [Bacillus sp. FJAT-27231]
MEVHMNGNALKLITGDITKQTTEAIVNAANGSLLGGGGVDGAIHRAAGKELVAECKKIREEVLGGDYLPTGEAVITNGYNLPAKCIIHTVGPIWHGNTQNEEALLANCYKHSLQLAQEKGMTSISFPSISTGVYRFPIDLAAITALKTIMYFLQHHSFGQVVMTLFSPEDYRVYESALQQLLEKQ